MFTSSAPCGCLVQLDGSIGAVVVGFDPTFSYDKLAYASLCLREIPECHFVVTNGDHGDNVGNGRIMPVTGSLSAAIERASGRLPVRNSTFPVLGTHHCHEWTSSTKELSRAVMPAPLPSHAAADSCGRLCYRWLPAKEDPGCCPGSVTSMTSLTHPGDEKLVMTLAHHTHACTW